jgi:hypothetical protein
LYLFFNKETSQDASPFKQPTVRKSAKPTAARPSKKGVSDDELEAEVNVQKVTTLEALRRENAEHMAGWIVNLRDATEFLKRGDLQGLIKAARDMFLYILDKIFFKHIHNYTNFNINFFHTKYACI